MANPFLEDFLRDLQEIEQEKTSFGATDQVSLFPTTEEAQPQEEKNVLWDIVGSTAWSFADEAAFGGLSLGAYALDKDVSQFTPQTFPAKLGAGVGALAGFALGAPIKVGGKILTTAAKPFLKKAAAELGEDIVVGSAQTIAKKASKEAVDTGLRKEIADDFTRDFLNRTNKATFNKDIAKDFVLRSSKSIDDLANTYVKAGKITAEEADIARRVFQRDLTKRPIQNFKDLWGAQGKNPWVGNLLDEAIMFTAIDAIREVPLSISQEREYDFMMPLFGTFVGLGFGGIKFLPGVGKSSNFRVEMADGIRAAFGKNIFKGKKTEALKAHSKWLSEQMQDNADEALKVNRTVRLGGKDYKLDISMPEQAISDYGDKIGRAVLEKGLDEYSKSYGKELLKWSLKEEWGSLSENWFRMFAGSMVMNAHPMYEVMMHDAEISMEDMLPGMLIGAWMNRGGTPRAYDLHTRTNRVRKNLHMLGHDVRNMVDIPSYSPYNAAYMNPINQNEALRKVRDKAEELGIITDSHEQSIGDLPDGVGSVLVEQQTKGGYDVFTGFYNLLGGQKKFIKGLDQISVDDAKALQNSIKELKWDALNNKSINSAQELYHVVENVSEGAAGVFEKSLSNTLTEIKQELGVISDIDPSKATMGSFPKRFGVPTVSSDAEMPTLIALARNGKLIKGMEGDMAEKTLKDVVKKANKIIDVLEFNNRIKKTEKEFNLESFEHFDALSNIINDFEARVNRSVGSGDGFKFNLLEHIDDLQTVMLSNSAKTSAKNVSTLFTQGSTKHPGLQRALQDAGILHGDELDGLVSIPDVADSNIKIEGNPDRIDNDKRFLGQVLSILKAKGQYNRKVPTEPITIDSSQIDKLKDFLGKSGMRTAPWIMEEWNGYTLRYIMNENIEGSAITMQDMNTFMDISSIPGLDLMKVSPRGRGFEARRIKVLPTNNEAFKLQAERYNAFVDKIVEAGATVKGGLISKGDDLTAVSPDFMRMIDMKLDYAHADAFASSRQAITDFTNSISVNRPAFIQQMRTFSRMNPDYAKMLEGWLVESKVISRERPDGFIKYRFNEDGLNDEVIDLLKGRMNEYGLSYDHIDAQYKQNQEKMMDIVAQSYADPHADNSLTQDQFFNKYRVDETGRQLEIGVADQDSYMTHILNLQSLSTQGMASKQSIKDLVRNDFRFPVKTPKGIEYKLGSELDLRNVKNKAMVNEAIDHLTSIMSAKINNTKGKLIIWDGGSSVFKEVSMQKTKLTEAMEKWELPLIFISGSGENFGGWDGKLQRRRLSLFESESQMLSESDKVQLIKNRKAFEEELSTVIEMQDGNLALDPFAKESISSAHNPGMDIFVVAEKVQPIGIGREYLPQLATAYENLFKKVKNALDPTIQKEMEDRIASMKRSPNMKVPAHEQALRQLMFSEISIEGKNYKDFADLMYEHSNPNGDPGKISKRLSLFHTPNFKKQSRFVTETSTRNANDDRIVDKYFNRLNNKVRVGILDDSDRGQFSIKEKLRKQLGDEKFEKFWKNELHDRADESPFDSISYISADMMRFWSLAMGRAATNETQLFKPVISSTGDALLLGKTVFVHDPNLETFFKTQGADILTMDSASKVKGPGWNKITGDQFRDPKADLSGAIREIDLDNIRIKQDRIHTEDTAKQSQSAWNYMSSAEAENIFGEMYAEKLGNGLRNMADVYNNPDTRRMFFDTGSFEDQSVRSLFEGSEGGAHLGAAKFAAANGMDPLELGDKMFASQLFRTFIDPIINPKAEVNGERYGGKAVIMQSLTEHTDLRATIVEDGKLSQYGQVVLPEYEMNNSMKAFSKKGMAVKVIRVKDQQLLDISELPLARGGKQVGTKKPLTTKEISDMTLGQIHDMVSTNGEYELAVLTNRYPRTRPNDMAILGLKGFLTKAHGNAMIVNDMDVLNIFEGDYDVDKNDYYFMQSDNLYKHVQDMVPHWAQGIDVDQFSGAIDGLTLSGNATTTNRAWSQQMANASTLKKGIGVTQKLHRTLNWLRDIAEIRTDKDGNKEYVILNPNDGTKIVMDYDNKDWWHRAVLETQGIIDAGTSANKSLLSGDIKDWRDDFLFPLKQNSYNYLEKSDNKVGFLRDTAKNQTDGKRIRLFRKVGTDGAEIDLSDLDKDILRTMLSEYGNFISIGSSVFDKTGNSKKPSYHDVIDLSDQYFGFMGKYGKTNGNVGRRVFYKLLNKHKDTQDFRDYFGIDQKPVTEWNNKEKKAIIKPGEFYDVNTMNPFPQAIIDNADNVARGKHGNVLDRIMHQVRATDPLELNTNYKAFSQADLIMMDEAINRFTENPQYRETFTGDVLAFASDINKGISTIRYLKRKFGFINNLKVSNKRKNELKDDLNNSIKALEERLGEMLPEKYKKTRKGEDLKAGYIKFVDLQNNQEMRDAAVQLYAMNDLARINHGTPQMHAAIKDLRALEARHYGDMNDLSYTNERGDATLVSQRVRDYLKGAKLDFNNIDAVIMHMIKKGVEEHEMSFLWHYALPTKNKNAIGIFNNEVVPVPYGGNGRMKRVIRFLAKEAQSGLNPDMLAAFKALGPVIGHHRNYFNKDWRYLSQDSIIDGNNTFLPKPSPDSPDGLTYEHLKFPSFSGQFENALDSFREFKWKKNTDVIDQFHTQDNPVMSFYRQFFDLHGKSAEFGEYINQRSVLHRELESNRVVDPMRYLAMVSNLDTDIHNFVKNRYTGAIGDDGGEAKVWNMDEIKNKDALKGSPIYALMGGSRYFKTLTLAPESKRTKRDFDSMREFGKFGQEVMETVSEGKIENLRNLVKTCTVRD